MKTRALRVSAGRAGRIYRALAIGSVAGAALLATATARNPIDADAAIVREAPAIADVASTTGEWPMATGTWQNTRYSALDQIGVANAGRLQVAWTFHTGIMKGQEAAPVVVGDRMYVVTPFPNVLYAFDLAKSTGGTGVVAWKYEPRPVPASQGVACCDVVNRGCAVSGGKVVFNTLDGRTCAVDARTGRELWTTAVGNIQIGETITMAPMIARGKVYVGNSGGEFGVRGWLKALDLGTGKLLWTAFNTGPDSSVKIGPAFHPFYAQDRGVDLGVKSWPPDRWQIGGGNVWGFLSYDPEQNLVIHGTGNPGSWNPELRPGDNKWTCGVFARDADTGAARWYYQFTPHDLFDHDGINENILVDRPWNGTPRKLLFNPGRNGYLYVIDRTNGQVLAAQPFVRITSSKGVDLKSGRLIPNDVKTPGTGKVVRDVAPASPGAKDWQPSAYSPRTGLLYLPHQTLSMDYEGLDVNYIEGTPYVGANVKMYADPVQPGNGHRGAFTAWDPARGRAAWKIEEPFPVWSGALVTAGEVAFYGTMDGWFKAVDARTGRLLWKYKTASGVIGQPTTFLGPDHRQYVAVLAGVGGWPGAIVSTGLDTRDHTAGGGFANAMADLPKVTGPGDLLYVFGVR